MNIPTYTITGISDDDFAEFAGGAPPQDGSIVLASLEVSQDLGKWSEADRVMRRLIYFFGNDAGPPNRVAVSIQTEFNPAGFTSADLPSGWKPIAA